MSTFDPYHRWLGIPPAEQPPHHYRLLGLTTFESDPEVVIGAADRQMAHLQTFKAGAHSELTQKLLNEVSVAKLCLLNAEKKSAYDKSLRQRLASAAQPSAAQPPAAQPPITVPVPRQEAAIRTPAPAEPPPRSLPVLPIALAGAGLLAVLLAVWFVLLAPQAQVADTRPNAVPSAVVPPVIPPVPPPVAPPAKTVPIPTQRPTAAPPDQPVAPERPPVETPASAGWRRGLITAFSFDSSSRRTADGKELIKDAAARLEGKSDHAAFPADRWGNALELRKPGEFVEIANAAELNPTRELSVAVWVNAKQLGAHTWSGSLVNKDDWGQGYAHGYGLRCGNSAVSWNLSVGNVGWQETVFDLDRGAWHHVLGTYGPEGQKLYVDGELRRTAPHVGPIRASAVPLRLGSSARAGDRQFIGRLDELAIWDRQLSAAEARELHAFSANGKSYVQTLRPTDDAGIATVPSTRPPLNTAPLPTKSEPLPEGKVRETVDLLGLVNPDRDNARLTPGWRREGKELLSNPAEKDGSYINIPYRMPLDYRLRLECNWETVGKYYFLGLSLVCGLDRAHLPVLLHVPIRNGISSGFDLDDKRWFDTETAIAGDVLPLNAWTEIVYTVRPGLIDVAVNGRSILVWKQGTDRFKGMAKSDHEIAPLIRPDALVLWAGPSQYRIRKLTLEKLAPLPGLAMPAEKDLTEAAALVAETIEPKIKNAKDPATRLHELKEALKTGASH